MAIFNDSNELFSLAVDLVNQSNRNIFLTGKAGTGKTTFLKYIKENSLKQTAVVAPTGVAAINAGGATIHSFFQLPFSPFIPEAKVRPSARHSGPTESSGQVGGAVTRSFTHVNEATDKHSLLGRMKLNRERIKILQQLELLIIDEISMVRCDTLDAIDVVLKHFRHRYQEPFGGVQVLLIGDMYQLPPVIPNEEWNLLSQFYSSPYFFDSKIMQEAPAMFIEFEKIYRQSDGRFIELLNKVRNNKLDNDGIHLLNKLRKDYKINNEEGYIILTTHNYKADKINADELSKITGQLFSFSAEIKGDFYEKAYPAEELLQLKAGAQVMFIKNDKEKTKRYFNGKIGTITKIENDSILVQCKNEEAEIEVKKETWENVRYTLNKSTQKIEEEIVGTFIQYPLRLAWAITIHKSQGLTFEKAVIDAGSAFAPGQVYVALSRCKSLDGIILQSQVGSASLHSDERIVRFSNKASSLNQLQHELIQSKKHYQQNILLLLFNFIQPARVCNELKQIVKEHAASFSEETMLWIDELEKALLVLEEVAKKFKAYLNNYFADQTLPEENNALQKRIKDASAYFIKQLDALQQYILKSPAVTDSKQHAKAYNENLKEVFSLLSEKKHLLAGFTEGFSVGNHYQQKKNFVSPPFAVNSYATASLKETETAHPQLHRQLRELRNKICEQKNLPIYLVASSKTIDEVVQYLPQTPEELIKISGFGKAKVDQYGDKFLELIVSYSKQHNLTSLVHEKVPKRERKIKNDSKPDTKTLTYQLYKEGKAVSEIAALRNLAVSTIEGHLAVYVQKGIISVNELVSREKILLIEPLLENSEPISLSSIKENVGDVVSYSEIKLVVAAKEWEMVKNESTQLHSVPIT